MNKILVIEDEFLIRENLLERLGAEGFDTVGAENGLDGVKLALADRPDLIICDVMMPELDGYDVLRTLRQNPNTAAIPFIFLTAKADKAALRQGMELGADDYLTKPFTKTELLGAIATRLEKHAIVAQHFEEELVSFVQSITDALPEELLNFGIDPNQQAPDGKTALIKAAERDRLEVMQILAAKTNVNLQDAAQATALMWAASRGDFQAVQLLLQAGADINLKNRGGYTALALAEFNGYQDIVQALQQLE